MVARVLFVERNPAMTAADVSRSFDVRIEVNPDGHRQSHRMCIYTHPISKQNGIW